MDWSVWSLALVEAASQRRGSTHRMDVLIEVAARTLAPARWRRRGAVASNKFNNKMCLERVEPSEYNTMLQNEMAF